VLPEQLRGAGRSLRLLLGRLPGSVQSGELRRVRCQCALLLRWRPLPHALLRRQLLFDHLLREHLLPGRRGVRWRLLLPFRRPLRHGRLLRRRGDVLRGGLLPVGQLLFERVLHGRGDVLRRKLLPGRQGVLYRRLVLFLGGCLLYDGRLRRARDLLTRLPPPADFAQNR
jgi:hypothetical protein